MAQMRSVLILGALLSVGLACNLSRAPTPFPSPGAASQVAGLPTAAPSLTPALPASSATASTAPSASATLTATPTSTPTPSPGDPRQALGMPDWRDTFQNGTGWDLSGGNPEAAISGGKLILTAPQADQTDWWRLGVPKLTDFYLEGTATVGSCHGLDRYGLVVRAPSLTQGYLFGFSCDGHYSLRKWGGTHFTVLQDWTESSWILSGASQTNRLGFLAKGNQLSLYANGHLLGQAKDASYGSGRFGVFLASVNTANFSVAFSELDYWTLP